MSNFTPTAEQIKLVQWLATPKRLRIPKTQILLAKALDVDEDTITNWKQIPEITRMVLDLITNMVSTNDVAEVLAGQVKAASKGNPAAARLIMEVVGMIKQDKPGDTTVNISFNRHPAGSGKSGVTITRDGVSDDNGD